MAELVEKKRRHVSMFGVAAMIVSLLPIAEGVAAMSIPFFVFGVAMFLGSAWVIFYRATSC